MRTTLLAGILVLSAVGLFGQSISTTHDIAVFRLAPNGTDVPGAALSSIDRHIRDVFRNAGDYTVVGIDHRITEEGAARLMERLKDITRLTPRGPAEVVIGAVKLTESEITRLSQAFMIIVPVVASYALTRDGEHEFSAELGISFTFISSENDNAVDHFSITTIGVGPTAVDASRDALGEVPLQLAHELRALPQFKPPPLIVDIGGSMVLVELGRSSGVHVGDRFAIVSTHELASGRTVTERTALLVVKEVKEDSAYARVINLRNRSSVGGRLERIPGIGFASSLYLHVVAASEPLGGGRSAVLAVGTLHTFTRGFYNLRPVLGFEVPMAFSTVGGSNSYSEPGIPLNFYAGAELNWRLWRFDLVPLAALGIGGVIPLSTSARVGVTVGGGLVQISVSFLISPRLKVFAGAGLEQWFPLGASGFAGWGGFYGGVGLTVDY